MWSASPRWGPEPADDSLLPCDFHFARPPMSGGFHSPFAPAHLDETQEQANHLSLLPLHNQPITIRPRTHIASKATASDGAVESWSAGPRPPQGITQSVMLPSSGFAWEGELALRACFSWPARNARRSIPAPLPGRMIFPPVIRWCSLRRVIRGCPPLRANFQEQCKLADICHPIARGSIQNVARRAASERRRCDPGKTEGERRRAGTLR